MKTLLNFHIQKSNGTISNLFVLRGIDTFHRAIDYVKNLPYGRNSNKDDLASIFSDNQGTCSTKHALLKQLAMEHPFEELQLLIGIFRMSSENTPKIAETLAKSNLKYLPEAHTYLKYQSKIYDFTTPDSLTADFEKDLLLEIEIQPNQINQYKIGQHQKFLRNWLNKHTEISYSFDELWEIREHCIRDLSQ